jgi:hypothetical protein
MMFEIMTDVLVYATVVCIIAFLVVKEFAAYRLPASHPLNVRLNPPRNSVSGDRSGSSWSNDGDIGGSDWSSRCEGSD